MRWFNSVDEVFKWLWIDCHHADWMVCARCLNRDFDTVIHHINGKVSDNTIKNLELMRVYV